MKSWFNSKTIWLMVSEAISVWLLYDKKELSLLAAILLTIQAIAGVVNRFFTKKSINNKGDSP